MIIVTLCAVMLFMISCLVAYGLAIYEEHKMHEELRVNDQSIKIAS